MMMLGRTRPHPSSRRKERVRARVAQARAEQNSRNGNPSRNQANQQVNQAREADKSKHYVFKVLGAIAILLFVIGVVTLLLDSGTSNGVSAGQIAGIFLILCSIGIIAGVILFCVYMRFRKPPSSQGSHRNSQHVNSVSRRVDYSVDPEAVVHSDTSSAQQDVHLEFGRRGSAGRNHPGSFDQLPDIRISPDLDDLNGPDADLKAISFDIDAEEGGQSSRVPPIDLSGVEPSPSPPSPRKSFDNPAYDSGDEEVPADYNAPPVPDLYGVPPDYDMQDTKGNPQYPEGDPKYINKESPMYPGGNPQNPKGDPLDSDDRGQPEGQSQDNDANVENSKAAEGTAREVDSQSFTEADITDDIGHTYANSRKSS